MNFMVLEYLLVVFVALSSSDPPPPSKTALTARYIIHNTNWATVSTISVLNDTKGYPFGNLKSMSDGPESQGTGIPYFFLTPLDFTGRDTLVDNRCTLMASLAETDYCTRKEFDAQDPRCARIIIGGHMLKVANQTEEFEFAKAAIFSRHPQMSSWPMDHGFYIAKLNVETIFILDYIRRGVERVTPEDYFAANDLDTGNEILNTL